LAADLRQQLAAAIAAEHHRRARARIEASPEQHAAGFADAAMAVVQPVLDAKDAEIKRLLALACPGCMAREQERDAWAEATRQNGIKAEEYKQAADHQRRRAGSAEAELTRLRDLHHQIGDQP
jgi:hypothetical protein